LFKFFQTCCTN